jgi:probable HAF family extracellular repeat protein
MVQSYECIAITPPGSLAAGNIAASLCINNQGVVAGSGWGEGKNIAFVYGETGLHLIDALNPYNAIVGGINDAGHIVGDIIHESTDRPRWRNFVLHDDQLDILDHEYRGDSSAIAINSQGHILIRQGGWRSFIYKQKQLYPLDASGAYRLQANSINDFDQVVGFGVLQGQRYSSGGAFVYSNGALTFIPKLAIDTPDKRINVAHALNNKGQIVGVSGSNARGRRAFQFSDDTLYDLGTVGALWSEALAINSYGDAVGYSGQPHRHEHAQALLWHNRDLINLNDYVQGTGWHLESAVDINDKGQIVGWGLLYGVPRLFIMNPIGL